MITDWSIKMLRYARFLLLLGGSFAFTACGTSPMVVPALVDETEPLEILARVSVNPAPRAVFPRPANKPSVPPKAKSAKPAVGKGGRDILDLNDQMLLGLSEREVAILLGPAAETLVSPPSRVLEYRFPGCELKLFLYANLETGDYAVLHLEANVSVAKTGPDAVCTARIPRQAQSQRAS